METDVDRRTFLARAGVLGLALSTPGGLLAAPARAATDDDIEAVVRWLTPILDNLSRETFDAMVAFCVPGNDHHSIRQGVSRPRPGGVGVGTTSYLLKTFNTYISIPDELWVPVILEGTRRMGAVPTPLPTSLRVVGLNEAQRFDRALKLVIENGSTIPAPIIVTLLLNITATLLVPACLFRRSPYSVPFARLSYREKAVVFRDMESPNPRGLALVGRILDYNLRRRLPPLLNFLTNALLAFPSGGLYSEQSTYDPALRRVTKRPIGWDQANYLPGLSEPPDGHAELLGYYQDRREVEA